MLTETMLRHNLTTGTWWLPPPQAAHPARARAVRSLRGRSDRLVTYEVNAADPQLPVRQFSGLTEHQSAVFESLALYIRLLYGDGIYHCDNSNGGIWLLVVSDGVIVPGTDCMVSPLVFETLMEGLKFSVYKSLPVRQLAEDRAEDILAHYQTSQQRMKKRRYLLWAVLTCCGLTLPGILLIFILTG